MTREYRHIDTYGMVVAPPKRRGWKNEDRVIGVDLEKAVFQLHGATADGKSVFGKEFPRNQFLQFLSQHPEAVIAMEAWGNAHYYWERMLMKHYCFLRNMCNPS